MRGVEFAEPYMADDPVQSGDENLSVRFFLKPVRKKLPPEPVDPNKPPSSLVPRVQWADDANGYPTFQDVEYVAIRRLGDNLVEHVSPARDSHRKRFAKAYEAFKAGRDGAREGFPLNEWPPVTRSEVEELALRRVYTVEQLAASDPNKLGIERGHPLVVRAKDFLAKAAAGAQDTKLRGELEARDAAIAQLQQQLAEQAQALARIAAERNGGPGSGDDADAVGLEQPPRSRRGGR